MEPRRNRADARWFLHAQGHTLGPYDDQGVLKGLRAGEVLPTDKIYSAKDGTWTVLSSHPYFQNHAELLDLRRANHLSSPPSPRKLRAKGLVPPPIPVLPTPPVTAAPLTAEATTAPAEPAEIPARMHSPLVVRVEPLPEPEPLHEITKISKEQKTLPTENEGLLEAVAGGPQEVVHIEPIVLTEPVMAPLAVKSSPITEEILEGENLEDMARALERALDHAPSTPQSGSPIPAIDSPIPARPEIKPVFLSEPDNWLQPPKAAPDIPRVIQIQLNLPEKAWAKSVIFAFVVTLALAGGYWLAEKNKTRDQKDFRLSDPSSPIAAPLETGDPIPPLKAPTRPQRD